jgi:hypothetical protein
LIPYTSKIHSDFVYEIWERAINYTFLDSFNTSTINELAKIEFENILAATKYDDDLCYAAMGCGK